VSHFRDKTALVTGGNSGIGRGIALRLAKAGARLIIVARDPEKGARVVAEVEAMGGMAEFHALDLAEANQVTALADRLTSSLGSLDLLVNNAGVGMSRGGVTRQMGPVERWKALRGPNLDATYMMSATLLPLLAKSDQGAIVNISSTATWHGNWGLYCAAKAGIEGLTRAFAAEAASHGVRVNGVSPGWIATENDATSHPAGPKGEWALPPSLFNRMGTPDEIAAAVLFLGAPDASFITGQTLIVDGGMMVIDYPSLPALTENGDKLRSRPE